VRVRAATWHDLEPVSALVGESRDAVRAAWRQPDVELSADTWLVERAGELVGYAALSGAGRLSLAVVDGDVADRLVAEAAKRGRKRGLASIALVASGDAPLLGRHPFELEAETLAMWRRLDEPLPECPVPPGVRVRAFERADARAVHALLDEAYGSWDDRYVGQPHERWLRSMTGDAEFDPSVWWLAERKGDLVGCALLWRSGWLKDLAVRDGERGLGLGAALVALGLREFERRGLARVGLKVDAANPTGAVGLYERLGFATERREAVWALTL
jgi:ribosomal protein S18 acetylase RimI-like enzyme